MSTKNSSLDLNQTLVASEAFLLKNKKILVGALIAIATVAAVWVGGCYYLNGQNEKGQAELALGQRYIQTGEWEKALKGDGAQFKGYLKIADTYSWTDAANLAHLYAGDAYFGLGDYKKAIAEFEQFSTQGDNTVSPLALAKLGNAYAAENQLDKAVEYLKDAASAADNKALSPIFLKQAALILESQGKKTEAHALYEQIKKDYPTSMDAAVNVQNGNFIGADIDKYLERTK